ncbi:hypothetical protein CDD81_6712 [Ophiocordyceps australis]|uniref:Fungal calcium binding protein domain-containing protein n=1 Tax=Ophiocordyceps australis TaxID=1399860 RepID=A0A2C5Y6Z4_9HYPO|nr:hypothetical protein CDD81_6712 [Ophiocordyceps australis]
MKNFAVALSFATLALTAPLASPKDVQEVCSIAAAMGGTKEACETIAQNQCKDSADLPALFSCVAPLLEDDGPPPPKQYTEEEKKLIAKEKERVREECRQDVIADGKPDTEENIQECLLSPAPRGSDQKAPQGKAPQGKADQGKASPINTDFAFPNN